MAFISANLRLRIISALVLAPIAIGAVWCGGWIYAAFVALVTGTAMYEWLRLVNVMATRPTVFFAICSLMMVGLLQALGAPDDGLLAALVFMVILYFVARRDSRGSAALVAAGIPYIGGCAISLIFLRTTPGIGLTLVLYIVAVVWGTDIGAYIAGRTLGGPKIAPKISPNKTWAGLFGGMALASAFGYGVAASMAAPRPALAAILAVLLAGIAQSGDFFKSYFKRRAGVKDSGHLIPGHGGVLDRIDGLIFAAVFFALFEAVVHPQWW
jgi:phosphatidate cytidylyltransferase